MPGEDTVLLAEISRNIGKLLSTTERTSRGGDKGAAAKAGAKKETSITARAVARTRNVASGRALGGGLKGLAAQGALAAASAAVGAVGAFAVGAQRTGTAEGGAQELGRSAISAVASIPLIGELTGAAQTERIASGTERDLNSATNQVARFAGAEAITPQVRTFLAQKLAKQNENLEDDRRANRTATNQQLGSIAENRGGIANELLGQLGKLAEALSSLTDSIGAGAHT